MILRITHLDVFHDFRVQSLSSFTQLLDAIYFELCFQNNGRYRIDQKQRVISVIVLMKTTFNY